MCVEPLQGSRAAVRRVLARSLGYARQARRCTRGDVPDSAVARSGGLTDSRCRQPRTTHSRVPCDGSLRGPRPGSRPSLGRRMLVVAAAGGVGTTPRRRPQSRASALAALWAVVSAPAEIVLPDRPSPPSRPAPGRANATGRDTIHGVRMLRSEPPSYPPRVCPVPTTGRYGLAVMQVKDSVDQHGRATRCARTASPGDHAAHACS